MNVDGKSEMVSVKGSEDNMRIITAYQQGQALAHLWKIEAALKSDDVIERLNAIENVAELTFLIYPKATNKWVQSR